LPDSFIFDIYGFNFEILVLSKWKRGMSQFDTLSGILYFGSQFHQIARYQCFFNTSMFSLLLAPQPPGKRKNGLFNFILEKYSSHKVCLISFSRINISVSNSVAEFIASGSLGFSDFILS
jgi:hypothetical protein